MPTLIAVIIAVVVLVAFAVLAGRRGREIRDQAKAELAGDGAPILDVSSPRPVVIEFHVVGEEARVTFDVPVPDGDVDEVLADLLVSEAVEVTREKAETLPIDQVTKVVALAGRGGPPRAVGSRDLEFPGQLPPALGSDHLLQFSKIGFDPLDQQFSGDSAQAGFEAPTNRGDELGPIGPELRLPRAVEVGLRSQGVDPETMSSGELVRTMLALFGYSVSGGEKPNTYFSDKGGQRTYIREEPHESGGYPELEEGSMTQFIFDFTSSGADRGLLVTDKYGPFEVYERERREPRVRFVTRERLQKFVDALALE